MYQRVLSLAVGRGGKLHRVGPVSMLQFVSGQNGTKPSYIPSHHSMSVHNGGTGCQGPEAGRAPGDADISKVEGLRGPFEHGAVRLTVELDLLQTTPPQYTA